MGFAGAAWAISKKGVARSGKGVRSFLGATPFSQTKKGRKYFYLRPSSHKGCNSACEFSAFGQFLGFT